MGRSSAFSDLDGHLRILVVIEACGGGVGRHVADLCRELVVRGHVVYLAYSDRRVDARFQRDLEDLSRLGCHLHALPIRRGIDPSDIINAYRVRQMIRTFGPFDIIHAHSSKAGAISRVAAWGMKPKTVYTPHAFITMSPGLPRKSRRIYSFIERGLSRISGAVVAVSSYERNHAVDLGIDPKKISVIPNGIGLPDRSQRSDLRKEWAVREDELVFGFVGRLDPQKAPHILVEAFAKTQWARRQSLLVIAGDGPMKSELRHAIDAHALEGRVRLIGYCDGSTTMAAFDAFVLPSLYESFPYVLLEATANGLPIICTDTGVASEFVTSDIGMLVPVCDVDALAEAMDTLVTSPDLRQAMSKGAPDKAEIFSVESMVTQIERLYYHLIGTRFEPSLQESTVEARVG